jgi:hypothetical protein
MSSKIEKEELSKEDKETNESKEQNEPKETNEKSIIELQLGDVIQISNLVNEKLDNQTFIIDYIDKSKAYLINTDTIEKIKVKISEDGIFGDGNIRRIAIISRASDPGYAKQHGLVSGKWINIYFGGDFPVIITGEITNLEEDMIEVKTIDDDTLYINFEYKGIPEDLPIETIEIREKPSSKRKEREEEEYQIEDLQLQPEEKEMMPTEQLNIQLPIKNIKDQLREFIIKADQIKFGDEEFGPIIQYVDVSSKSQRYSIETQVADLMDELLSTIPSAQRTRSVLNNIHITIERFKQLRETFSYFDQYSNIEGPKIKKADYKPLSIYFQEFKQNLFWIVPVVKNIKKIYNAAQVEDVDEESNDVIMIPSQTSNLIDMEKLIENYRSNTLPTDQNKYSTLYNELNSYFTPFDLIDDDSSSRIMMEKIVNNDINTIIDNLEDMYSSVFTNNMINSRRFVMQKYNLGLKKLDSLDSTSSRLITVRTNMTPSDIMSIKSFVTLPEPTIRFSKINLPGTSILDRANLNNVFLNYWDLLKKKTNINTVFIDSINDEIEFNENNFVNSIKNYVLNLNNHETRGLTKDDIYSKFIDIIIPKIRILFNLMKKYIIGKLSIVDVVSYLEPFLVYADDLTYNQYIQITKFINEKISEYNKKFVEKSRVFVSIIRIASNPLVKSRAYSIIDLLTVNNNIRNEVFTEGYDISMEPGVFTNSELLRKIILKDYSKLYTTAISVQNIPLMFPNDITEIFNTEKEELEKKLKTEENRDKCKTTTIAKMYQSLDELNEDNDKTIYFDKKYDKTNYGMLDANYASEIIRLSPEELKAHIVKDLVNKKGFSEPDADYMADTLLDGHKKVRDGQYGLLFKGFAENVKDEVDYYVRKDNKWVLDKELSSKGINTDESSILCDLQEKCISVPNKIDDKCESIQFDELGLQTKLLNDVISEFDTKYKMSKEDFAKKINDKFAYFMSIMGILSNMETNQMLKYNNQKYKLGSSTEDEIHGATVSPHTRLLNLILNQSDFVKKQTDIIRFVNTYTRPASDTSVNENKNWLYCLQTGVPLLPLFKFELASEYVTNPAGYMEFIELLKTRIGKLSDDGDMWIDKHSGWTICRIDFDIEEGYEEGFKVSTRAIMEGDAGSQIMSSMTNKNKGIEYNTPETKTVNNIINALSVAMGINIEIQKEFIINCVLTSMRDQVESESEYKEKIKEMAQKGKKMASYKEFYNSAILYFTLGSILIAIQTAMPSIRTRKTHPGCVRSFIGYPFEGAGDLSSLNYIACVAYDIRESGEPWNVLKGKKVDVIINKIKASIDGVLLALPDVKRKMDEKTEYLLTGQDTEIPEEHDLAKWTQFLPPLVPFKIKNLNNISTDFKKGLLNDLRSGSEYQREKLLVVDSKIIQFSLAIQERIQGIVKKNKLILHNSNNEPYLENACCESKEDETTIAYFVKNSPEIKEYNEIVTRLTNILEDVISYSKGGIFYSNINTKNKYPSLTSEFDEKTIYLAFIYFCKFKSLIPIPEDLLPLCTNKPDSSLINPNDSVERIIQKLKDDGRNYTNNQFLRMLQLIGRTNVIDINLNTPIISSITRLSGLLNTIDDENDEVVERSLRELILNTLDTFDIASHETSKEVKALNNYLVRGIETMKEELVEFIEKNYGTSIPKSSIRKATQFISNLSSWVSDNSSRNEDIKISEEKMYNIVNFYKTFIDSLVTLFPNIILNKVDHNDVSIPAYYGFSSSHSKKLKKYISKYYEKLNRFYGVPTLSNVLTTIQKTCINIVRLAKETPSFSTIKNGDKTLVPIFDEKTSRYLYEYYLLRIFINYIELSDEEDMIVKEIVSETGLTDLYTIEYTEEKTNRMDLTIGVRSETDRRLLSGNKKELRQSVVQIIIAFLEIMDNHKETIDTSYEEIQDRVFKLREREKDMVTDRLKNLTDEQRDADTILKINKLGQYSKGLQKGLTVLDKDFYDEEREFRDEMTRIERNIRKKNRDVNDDNIDLLIDDQLEQQQIDNEIDTEAYDMENLNDDYMDGDFDGQEQEYDDYGDYL